MKKLNADEQEQIEKQIKNGCTYNYTELATMEWRGPSEDEREIIGGYAERIKSLDILKEDGILFRLVSIIMTFGCFCGTFYLAKAFGNPALKGIGTILLLLVIFGFSLLLDFGFGYMCIDMFFLKTKNKFREMLDAENYAVLDVKAIGYYERETGTADSRWITYDVYTEYNGRYVKLENFVGLLSSEQLFLMKLELKGKKSTACKYVVILY